MLEVIVEGEVMQLSMKPGIGEDDRLRDTLQNNWWSDREKQECAKIDIETGGIGHRRRDYYIIEQSAGKGTRPVKIGEANPKCSVPRGSS